MTLHLINPKAAAMPERDRLAAFLAAIEAVKDAQLVARKDNLSIAAESLVLEALISAEDRLRELTLDPDLIAFLECILSSLSEIAEGRP